MPFNFFGSPSRPTPEVLTLNNTEDNVVVVVTPTSVTGIEEIDSHIDTAHKMEEIRIALRAQQIDEDARTEELFLKSKSEMILNTSRTMTETSQTPSPQRRHHRDNIVEPTTAENHVSQSYYWDNINTEKKDDDDDDDDYYDKNSKDNNVNENDELSKEEQEQTNTILYNDGATELFKCIEEGMWDRATNLLQYHPEQASIWILSTGTMNTTFNWSKWKRLPIHEAARRQPPTTFMTLLIATYPDGVKSVTQFGELPLHLAVECGASPSVVNLLAVSHWRGCHETDQSGRTPLDVLQENDLLLDPIEHKAVVDALQASALAHEHIVEEHTDEILQLHEEHAMGLLAIRQQHDDDLQEEQEKQEKLLQQVASLQQQLSLTNSVIARQQVELHGLKSNEQVWKDHVNELQNEKSKWMDAYNKERETVHTLQNDVCDRDNRAIVLADRIVDLQTCIQRLAHWHQTTVRTQLASVTKSFENVNKELSAFTNTLQDHDDDLQTLLIDMGVDEISPLLPSITTTTTNSESDELVSAPKSRLMHFSGLNIDVNGEEDALDIEEDDEMLVSRAAQSAKRTVLVPADQPQK
jgi:hypothetical protein